MSRLSSLPMRWGTRSSGRNEDKGDFSHDRCREKIDSGAAPFVGSAGTESGQGAQSQNAQTHSGGCNSGKGAAGGAGNGVVCTGGLPDAEAVAAQLNPLGGLRETGGFPLFSPEGRTYSPPAKAGGGSPPVGRARALSEGDCVSCGSRWTMPQPAGSAVIVHADGKAFPCWKPLHHLPAQTCHRQLCRKYRGRNKSFHPLFGWVS